MIPRWTLLLGLCVGFGHGAGISQLGYQVNRLVEDLTNGPETGEPMRFLEELCDDYGPRQTGSRNLENAIDFVVSKLRNDGFDNVHTERVEGLPYWIRGDDRVEMIEPRHHKLNILAVDGSPPGFVEAEIVVVSSYGQLSRLNYAGKIVVVAEPYYSYGHSFLLRRAAHVLAERGARAVLLNSATPYSLYTPHTGNGARGSRIPSACITDEEAQMLLRLYKRKKRVVLRVDIRSRDAGYKTSSRNTVFEIKGSKKPTEIVLISAHLDSWDVGQGAVDDGGGVAAIRSAMRAIKALAAFDERYRPMRTIRAVLFTAEEQGYLGAKAYQEAHKNEKIVFAAETDQGAFRPRLRNSTLTFMGDTSKQYRVEDIARMLTSNGIPMTVKYSDSQGDVYNIAVPRGVPSVNFVPDKGGENFYFRYHHSAADYVSVFERGDLEYTASVFATMATVIANQEGWW